MQTQPDFETVYRDTDYRVFTAAHPDVRVLTIDRPSPALATWMQQHAAATAAFITACNPLSAVLPDAANAERMAGLRAALGAAGIRWLPAEGRARSGSHVEPSLLALGLDLQGAQALMRRYEQHAFLWIEADGAPRLIWTEGLPPRR